MNPHRNTVIDRFTRDTARYIVTLVAGDWIAERTTLPLRAATAAALARNLRSRDVDYRITLVTKG
jgi:hypothetical protein